MSQGYRVFASMSVLALGAFLITVQGSAAQTPPAPKQPAKATKSTPAEPEKAPSSPVRTETIAYDSWTVSCRDTADGKTKKVCTAVLPMAVQEQNRQVSLGNWILGRNTEGALVTLVQTPQIDIGVLIAKGIELKLGNGKPRKINFVVCNPQRCEGSTPMDDAFTKELLGGGSGEAVITFWKADGAEFAIKIGSIKGIDKAIAAIN
jgi:invasion protein IalB